MASSGLGYFDRIADAAREIVGPATVAWMSSVPGNRPNQRSFYIERHDEHLQRQSFAFTRMWFTSHTLDRIVIPPLAGRLFGAADTGECPTVIVSKAAARSLAADPIVGRSLEMESGAHAEIVGVVAMRDGADLAAVLDYARDNEDRTTETKTYWLPRVADEPTRGFDVHVVSPNYFSMLGVPLISGRVFDEHGGCRQGIVNEEAAEMYFGRDAIGGAVIDEKGHRTEIVGVVRSLVLRAAQRAVAPTLYLPLTQDFQPRMTGLIATPRSNAALVARLRSRLGLVPGGRPDRIIVSTLDEHLSHTALAAERIATVLTAASAAIAIVLGIVGLYGVMNEAARRRQREFALRLALGAGNRHLFAQVVSEGVRLVIAGTVSGTAIALLIAGWLRRVAPVDGVSLLVWLSPPVALALAVTIASVLPARRAGAIDPLAIMRDT
jgi:hypothetical protein